MRSARATWRRCKRCAEAWRPWRAYAVMRPLADPGEPTMIPTRSDRAGAPGLTARPAAGRGHGPRPRRPVVRRPGAPPRAAGRARGRHASPSSPTAREQLGDYWRRSGPTARSICRWMRRARPSRRRCGTRCCRSPAGPHQHLLPIAARRAGSPRAVRAAGAAIGRNPLSIIVPCHRVLGRDGSLTGYAGGLARKQALLQLEGAWPEHGAPA